MVEPTLHLWLYEGKHHGGTHTSSHHCVGHCLAFSDAQPCFTRYSCKMISCDKLLQPAPDKDAVQTEALKLQRTSWAAAGYGDSTGAGGKSQVQHWSQACDAAQSGGVNKMCLWLQGGTCWRVWRPRQPARNHQRDMRCL